MIEQVCAKCLATCIVTRNGNEICNQCGTEQGIVPRRQIRQQQQVPDRSAAIKMQTLPDPAPVIVYSDIDRASKINGWMSERELQWLSDRAKEHNLIVELGSYRGRSTRALGDSTKGKVIAIDHWQGEPHLPMEQEERDRLFKEFKANLSDLIENEKVVPVNVNHADVNTVPMLAEIKPDFVFVDGDHNQSRRDIQTWLPKIILGGIIAGHDSTHIPIAKTVAELLPSFKLIKNTKIWYATV